MSTPRKCRDRMLSPGILCEAHGRGQAYLGNPAHIGIGADLPSPNPATDSKRRRARFRDVPPTRPTREVRSGANPVNYRFGLIRAPTRADLGRFAGAPMYAVDSVRTVSHRWRGTFKLRTTHAR